ncbi:hypothetical protein RSAG8_12515, partial [Rhizoctonia solani AG-8 WAC10335]
MVRKECGSIYPTCTFPFSIPLSDICDTSALLHDHYKLGLGQIHNDIQDSNLHQVNISEFQAFKSKWISLRDRLGVNSSASEEDRAAWVHEIVNGVLGPSDPGSWLSKVSKTWSAVANLPSRIRGSANTGKFSDPEFIAQLGQWEQNYPCLTPFVRLIYHILQKGMEEFEESLISRHLDNIVSFEKQTRCKTFEEECARAQHERENVIFNELIQSLKQAMCPPSNTVSTLCVESIQVEYRKSSQGIRPTGWLSWSGSKQSYIPPRARYNIYPFEFTIHDRQQSELNEDHVPTPRIAGSDRFNFAVPTNKSIEFVQLVQNKCLLAISDVVEKHTRIYVANNVDLKSELQTPGLITLHHEKLGGSRCVYAFDQATRFFAIVHGREDPQLSLLRFDQQFTNLQGYRAPISLRAWYKQTPEISAACFQSGRSELFLIEPSGGVHVVSISAEMIRPAPFQLDPSFINVCSTPDGSCLLVVMGGALPVDPHRLLAFHWDTSGLEDHLEGIEASDLPPSETPCVVTRFHGKGRTHVVSFLPTDKLVKSTSLQVKQKTTEFAIRSEKEGLPTGGIQTANNALIDCHLEVWTRFPVVPTITRITPFPISRKPHQLVFVSPIALPRTIAYFERMISTLRRTTHKPVDWALTSTMVSSTKAISTDLLESLSEFKLGSFIVELICMIPIHIAATMDNKFMPLKDGVWDPDYESSLVGSTIEEINESLSFGWYESIFRSYMADKMVRVVSSMGEQSVGKSYCLNHFADTSFAGSAMRTTEGAWCCLARQPMTTCLFHSILKASIQSTERSPQEDMLLVLFNTAISNLILFRNNFAVSRNVRGLFTSFELSAGTFDPNLNPGLFQSTLAIIIKDVTDADTVGIKTEFRLKFGEIVKTERNRNFISRLHRGKILITPWPVINSPEFYSLFDSVQEKLEGQAFTQQTGGGLSYHKLKTLMVNIKTCNWDSIEQSMASSRAHQLKERLKMALSHETTSEGPLKAEHEYRVEEIVTSDDKPVLFVPEDPGAGIVGARDLSSEAEAEFKKQQEETLEETLKALIQRCEPLSHPRSQMPDSDYMEALQESLDNILDRRPALVNLWISVNTDHLPPENPDLLELNRVFDLLKRDMMAAVRLCRSGCASCGLQCIRAYSHSGEHDCSTDHKCKSHCEVLDDHSDLPSCGQKAGHTGRHMCDVNNHSCGSACNLSGWAGCTQICTKPLDHKDEHLCSAPSHHCGKPCDLRNVPGGLISSKFDCPGKCQKPWDEKHDQHRCNVLSCPIPCILCARSVKNPPDCCSTDHFHGLNLDATHICRADHACSENCEADGICHIDFTPSEKTFIGKHASYAYTRHEQVGKKLPCKVRIPQGEVSHPGPHNHDPEKNEHQCDAQCSGCKYYCTHPINHRQRLHATVHGSMVGTQWVIESEANEAYKLEEHRYASGDSGDSMFCSMLCVKQGRHAHIDFCRDPSNHTQPLCEHISSRVEPEPNRDKDWISHTTYWERTGFEDPYGIGQQKEFAKCDARCADPAHGDPSECILPIFHAPKSQNPSPSTGYISQDGHQFACVNPANVRQAYHVIFVVDNSGSMGSGDITPQPTPIHARLGSENCDNRYGAVVSALYSFWKSREGHQVRPSSVVREDHYSVVVFDNKAEARVENDWRLTTNQLVDKLIPQKYVHGCGTNFEEGIKVAHEVLEKNWSSQRAPILVFLSDGEGWIEEESIRNLCNLSVKLGQALAFYAISFGPDSESNSLRLMVSVAEQAFQGAPSSAKGAYMGQDPPCKYFSNTMTSIQLSNTFVRISNSLPKLRASVINKTGASGR